MAKSLPAVEAADETRQVVEFVEDSWTLKRIFRIYEIDIHSCRGWKDGREGNRKVSVKWWNFIFILFDYKWISCVDEKFYIIDDIF